MLRLKDENLIEVKNNWTKSQKELFERWERLIKEYNYIKLYGMLGSDCSQAWERCLKIQEEIFLIYRESVYEPKTVTVEEITTHNDQLV